MTCASFVPERGSAFAGAAPGSTSKTVSALTAGRTNYDDRREAARVILESRLAIMSESLSFFPMSSAPRALRPAPVITRLTRRPASSSRQTGIPLRVRISRINFRSTRPAAAFVAAALRVFVGTVAAPSCRAAAIVRRVDCVWENFANFFSFACDSPSCHHHDPAMATRPAGLGEVGAFYGAATRPDNQCSVWARSPVLFLACTRPWSVLGENRSISLVPQRVRVGRGPQLVHWGFLPRRVSSNSRMAK